MHIYPRCDSDAWKWHLTKIGGYLDRFNGSKIIAAVIDEYCDPGWKDLVPAGVDRISFVNDPRYRETITLGPLLELVRSGDSHEATFFCHSKGITRGGNPLIQAWSELMYSACLDYIDSVKMILFMNPTVGAIRKVGEGFDGSWSDWHFTGSFYWLRHDELYSRNWRMMDFNWYGVESYPSIIFPLQNSAHVVLTGEIADTDMYNEDDLLYMAVPTYNHWVRRNAYTKRTSKDQGSTAVRDGLRVRNDTERAGGGDQAHIRPPGHGIKKWGKWAVETHQEAKFGLPSLSTCGERRVAEPPKSPVTQH
jgi:hypothetical protein